MCEDVGSGVKQVEGWGPCLGKKTGLWSWHLFYYFTSHTPGAKRWQRKRWVVSHPRPPGTWTALDCSPLSAAAKDRGPLSPR